MTDEHLNKLCADAVKRIAEFINRSAAQHIRAIKNWSKK